MSRTLVMAAAMVAIVWIGPGPPAAAEPPAAPRIDAVTPLARLSSEICVCGHFPTPASAAGLRIDGRPLTVSGPFDEHVVRLQLPPGLAPGPHTITGAPEAEFDPEDRVVTRLVEVNTKVCHPLPFGPRRRFHLIVAGTEEPVDLRVRNQAPGIVTLSGGPLLEVRTSGGRHNQAVVAAVLTGLAGRENVIAELDTPRCPCSREDTLSQDLARSLKEVESWFRELEPELREAAQLGRLSAADVLRLLNELERRLVAATADPELAVLRAWIEDRVAEERALWRGRSGTGGRAARPSGLGLAFAGYVSSAARQGSDGQADSLGFIDRVLGLFQDLDEVSRNLYADLCVRFDPVDDAASEEEALLWLYPKRYPARPRKANPDTVVPRLTRGLYCLLVTEPELSDEGFRAQVASGSCRESSRSFGAGTLVTDEREVEVAWAQGEADLVRELDRYLACGAETHQCSKRNFPPRFTCVRSVE